MPLSRDQYQRAVEILTPHFNVSADDRKALVNVPLYGSPVMTKVKWDMKGAVAFSAHFVDELVLFDDVVSVCAVLRHIATLVGEPTVTRIADLIREIEGGTPRPKPESPARPEKPTTTDSPHAFISYSRKDTAFVERLEAALNKRGVATWRDATSIPGGDDWYQSISEGLKRAYAVVCIVTVNADESKWVRREQLRADEDGIPPIAVHPTKYRNPLHLQEVQPILMDEDHFDAGLDAVHDALERCKREARPAPRTDDAVQEFLRWVLTEAHADLRDSLYVDLAATPERTPTLRAKSPLAGGLDDDGFVFTSIPLEQVDGDDLAKAGEDVPDAREAIREMRRAVLLGAPGAGKTTTLLKITVDLARAAQSDPTARLPLYVPLREFNGTLTFVDFVRSKAHNLQTEFESLRERFVLLCDALNEMPRRAEDGRDLVTEVRDELSNRTDWVVSCRVRDYTEDLSAIRGTGKIRLKPLDPPRIRDFIERKFAGWKLVDRGAALWRALYGSDDLVKAWDAFVKHGAADGFWGNKWLPQKPYSWSEEGHAWRAMRADHRKLMILCRNPFMANVVCALYRRSGALPDNRAGLFRDFVVNLLRAEEKRLTDIGLVWIGDEPIRAGMAQIAWAMGAQTEMPRADAEAILQARVGGHEPAAMLTAATSAQILDGGSSVRFTHQLLQQYFAASVLGSMRDEGDDPASIWKPETWWESTGREETAILLAGDRNDPLGVARWIAPAQPHFALELLSQPDFAFELSTLEGVTRAALVASAEAKAGMVDVRGRAAAYRVLGRLKVDDRPGIGTMTVRIDGKAVELPEFDWCPIPMPESGTFWIGADDRSDNPRREVELRYDFAMARYPVTYRQFQAFVNSGEYDDRPWWDEFPPEYQPHANSEPGWPIANHPIETVSWYQAVAFTRWLTDKYRKAGLLDKGQEIRLPTEQEWEYAARGTDERDYPYPGKFDPAKGNTYETGIGATTAVGVFEQGASPFGVLDMSGNVWEWCMNKYREPDISTVDASGDMRVLRGGSWYDGPDLARAASRDRAAPRNRRSYYGFRVCRPPSR